MRGLQRRVEFLVLGKQALFSLELRFLSRLQPRLGDLVDGETQELDLAAALLFDAIEDS